MLVTCIPGLEVLGLAVFPSICIEEIMNKSGV